ncbi:methyltransferase domain-containing protein [Desertifilum sp. FACHB-1129]|nr:MULTISPECIES: class I SAM-dependent methyltransferase [unclassified Desertifilum]MDA0212718.1 methyltransferase domain-containing protein [Cyanobacteria bacterium FC1]OEJ75851.1 methyltransferase [Desertifilum tharense IPPAS B-1220]MBD2313330.1 methyltransferase domain-containing protein [Desertifilum sp. FACHB-1129]MBD2324401.1 methyltransferase domain-containing protein [Desertifilum sp. FACHB-866]MBD2334415.1 methyltransferase domain-containing protein [Desertifilum sp. FACHB-868]
MSQSQPERSWYNHQPLEERKTWYSAVAQAYNRVRPRYPQAMVERAIELAQLPDSARLLEVGCGPGTATTSFAQFGFSMVCLEPSPDAYQLARENCKPYPNVEIVNTTFEEWTLEPGYFDAILAATSFHWVSPEVGYAKAASALRDRGSLILLWNMSLQPAYEVYQALDTVYQTYAPSLAGYYSTEKQQESLDKFAQIVLNSGQFGDLVSEQMPCEVTYSIEDYLALLGTYSPYIGLEPQQRQGLFQALGKELENSCGEKVKLSYLSAFQIARKV